MCDDWRPHVLGLRALAAVAMVALAGCGGGSSPPGTGATGTPQPRQGVYTASQLRDALLTTVDGAGPAVPVQEGVYGSLRGTRTMKASMRGMRIIPARCARAANTGLNSAALSSAPATVASFRHGSAGVSEILLAPPGSLAATALGRPMPRECGHYTAVVAGRPYEYTVKNERAPRFGQAAREVNVQASGGGTVDVWTVIYRANGYVGAITLVGATATRRDVESIARRAYDEAQRTLR